MNFLKTNPISIGAATFHTQYLISTFKYFNVSIQDEFSSLSNSSSTVYNIYPSFDVCLNRNYYLEKYDAILMEPYAFSFFVRLYNKSRFAAGNNMEVGSFVPIPLIPYEIYTNGTYSERAEYDLFNVEKMASCENQPDISDAQFIRLLTGYSNFSQIDISLIESITSKSHLYGNWTLVNSKSPQILNFSTIWTTFNTTSLNNLLLPSSCYMCKTSACVGENYNPVEDYWKIPQFLIIFGYFALLFGFGLFKKPSLRRRIALPYTPILVFILMLTFTDLSLLCVCVVYNISTFVLIWGVFIYSVTVIRFYYLRNLYSLITKYPKRERFMKMLASEKYGILLSVVFTFILALIFNLMGLFMFFDELKVASDVFRSFVFGLFVLIGAILGLIIVIWDMISNSKRIRTNGLIQFLFFDDPLYVRLDILSLTFIIIVIIIIQIGNTVVGDFEGRDSIGGLFNTIICLSLVLITGGNTVMIEIYKKIRYAKMPKRNQDELEAVLQNEALFNLLQEYSAKEFSSENIEFYTVLMKLKGQKVVSVKELEEIDTTFIKSYSKFEVNFPSSCKKEFYHLKEEAKDKSQIEFSKLWQVVGYDLVLNMLDTFKRLQETPNYRKWESVSKYQKYIQ